MSAAPMDPWPRLLVATRSGDKLREIRDIVADLPVDLVSPRDLELSPSPEEEGLERHDTFAENAIAKALHFHRLTGLPTIADDSGLCVDALGGDPGVRTKRFAPDEEAERWGRDVANNRLLLRRLRGVPERERGAEYRCAVAAVVGGEASVFEGRLRGRIATRARGSGGFGYDPLFLLPHRRVTVAELPPGEKRRLSHRAKALRAARPWLERLGRPGE